MTVRVAGAQLNLRVGDITGNEQMIADAIRRAEAKSADILLTPELALTGYPPEDLVHREDFVRANRAA
ncbi:MAG TPA: nitrilase-related carbon-nitrogen hydrolase, partial [Acidimicrobiia bacterium]